MFVGTADLLSVSSISGGSPTWTGRAPVGEFACEVQIRAHAEPVPATARCRSDGVEVSLAEPLRAVAPGQSMVLYSGTRVLGQSTIAAARR